MSESREVSDLRYDHERKMQQLEWSIDRLQQKLDSERTERQRLYEQLCGLGQLLAEQETRLHLIEQRLGPLVDDRPTDGAWKDGGDGQ